MKRSSRKSVERKKNFVQNVKNAEKKQKCRGEKKKSCEGITIHKTTKKNFYDEVVVLGENIAETVKHGGVGW